MSLVTVSRIAALAFIALVGLSASCALGVIRGDDYPAKWRDAPIGTVHDDWGTANRFCTSFVMWRLAGDGTDLRYLDWAPRVLSAGDDAERDDAVANARSLDGWDVAVGTEPTVGAIAVWTPTELGAPPTFPGHVAYVAEVTGEQVLLEEYNWSVRGGYGTRLVAASSVPRFVTFRRLDPNASPETPAGRPPASRLSFLGAGIGQLELLVDLADTSRVRVTVTRAGKTVRWSRVVRAGSARTLRVRTARLGRGSARLRLVVTPLDAAKASDPDGVVVQRRVRLVGARGI